MNVKTVIILCDRDRAVRDILVLFDKDGISFTESIKSRTNQFSNIRFYLLLHIII